MSLLPEDASFLEHVQAYFLAFRGDGVSLSPLDMQLLSDWRDQGIPHRVICRAIRKAAEAVHYHERKGAGLRTLRSCRLHVEREFRRFQGLSVGRAKPAPSGGPLVVPEAFAQKRFRKARAALEKALGKGGEAAHQGAVRAALAALGAEAPTDPQAVARRIARADEAQALAFARALPFADRRALVREVRQLAGPRPERGSARARRDALRAHLVVLARGRGKLTALV
jgi:hypothetical protein